MKYTIANVKISVKISKLPLDIVMNKLNCINMPFQLHNNFLVVKSKFTFIIFKPKFECITHTNHVNITKIPNLSCINDAVKEIERLMNCETFNLTVDNISATSKHPMKLNLLQIVIDNKFGYIKYNNQAFPGLFLKFRSGTAIIFHSGKLNIVGCKSEEDVKWILKEIFANI